MEHQWDEGFGYFGAARSYDTWTDDEIADNRAMDDDDGAIDLKKEYSYGHSVNAAKRDRGAVVATDMTADAFDAFLAGRELLCDTVGELTSAQRDELYGYRDIAVTAEEAIMSTVIHYINDTLQDMGKMGTADYSLGTHAKHWSEMKGFALLPVQPAPGVGERLRTGPPVDGRRPGAGERIRRGTRCIRGRPHRSTRDPGNCLRIRC